MAFNRATQISRLEEDILKVLCQGTAEGPAREFMREHLRNYRWHEPAHQIIFQALLAIPSKSVEMICAELPAQLTRMGFPDLEWERLFEGELLSKSEAEDLVRRIRETRDE